MMKKTQVVLDSVDDGSFIIVHEIELVRYIVFVMFSSLLLLEGSDSYG